MISEDCTLPCLCSEHFYFQLDPWDYTLKNVSSKGDVLLKSLNQRFKIKWCFWSGCGINVEDHSVWQRGAWQQEVFNSFSPKQVPTLPFCQFCQRMLWSQFSTLISICFHTYTNILDCELKWLQPCLHAVFRALFYVPPEGWKIPVSHPVRLYILFMAL